MRFLTRQDDKPAAIHTPTNDPPSRVFDLREWKLQIPGPKEVKELGGYASPYFYLDAERRMNFHLNASEKGTTPNTTYVRSELRHVPNWTIDGRHVLSGEVRAFPQLDPDKLTVLQIHGITKDNQNAPPLLRVALNSGDLIAVVQTSPEKGKNEKIPLRKGLKSDWASVEIIVERARLTIRTDGKTSVERDLSFWPYLNYFKAGCYPQANKGTALVQFRRLTVR